MRQMTSIVVLNVAATAFVTTTMSADARPQMPADSDRRETSADGIGHHYEPVAFDVTTPSRIDFRQKIASDAQKSVEAVLSDHMTTDEKLRVLDGFIEESLAGIASILND